MSAVACDQCYLPYEGTRQHGIHCPLDDVLGELGVELHREAVRTITKYNWDRDTRNGSFPSAFFNAGDSEFLQKLVAALMHDSTHVRTIVVKMASISICFTNAIHPEVVKKTVDYVKEEVRQAFRAKQEAKAEEKAK